MRFKYEDVVLEIIEGDAIHPQIFSFENQGSFYERILFCPIKRKSAS